VSNQPLILNHRYETTGFASNEGITVTSGAAHAKGSYAQLLAATARPWEGFWLYIQSNSTTGNAYMLDIAIGASGGEQVILENFPFQGGGTTTLRSAVFLPIRLKAGARIAARVQCAGATQSVKVSLLGMGASAPGLIGFRKASCLNADLGTTLPTQVTLDNTWYELAASTATRQAGLLVMVNNATTNKRFNVDIGLGASGSELVLAPGLLVATISGINVPTLLLSDIKAGSRLAARANLTTTGGTVGLGVLGLAA
jgi:hypothetical protein